MDTPAVSIVILNWNGRGFLKTCVPSVLEATGNYQGRSEIIVVDNGSDDGSVDYLRQTYKQIKVVALEENQGFSRAMNIGVKASSHCLVIGLNNDTIVRPDFIHPLARHFADKDIFAVAAKMLLWDRKTLNFARAMARFQCGVFRRRLQDTEEAKDTLYACGGGFAVAKEKFLALGGFDEAGMIYWEDADLSYRAWKRGWRTLYEPASIIYHKFHGTNIEKYGRKGIQALSGENYFYFVFKNIHDKTLIAQQIVFMPLLIIAATLTGRSYFVRGLFRALRKLPFLMGQRRKEMAQKAMLNDREILCLSNK